MKDTDKVTLTLGQLKRLVNESYLDDLPIRGEAKDENKPEVELQDILDKIVDYSKLASASIDLSMDDKKSPTSGDIFKDAVQAVLYWSNKLDSFYNERIHKENI